VDAASYEAARIERGVPKRGVDYTNKTLPAELGHMFELEHVSYSKGCYVGQEVLMRIHSRGHTNKTWVGLLLDEAVQPGSAVSSEARKDAGVVTSAAISPQLGPIAGAMLRNEASREGAKVKVGNAMGRVRHFPLWENFPLWGRGS
jgi:folate-binding protein YgfZ